MFPQTSNSSHHEALLYVFEDNEAVIKMIIKVRRPTMRHVSRTHRVAFDWLFDRINLDSKIQIKYIDTKNQLADILTKRKSHVTNRSYVCSISAISVLQCALLQWRSDLNKIQEKNEVTAKSRPMMNRIARTSSHVSSSTSVCLGEKLRKSRSLESSC